MCVCVCVRACVRVCVNHPSIRLVGVSTTLLSPGLHASTTLISYHSSIILLCGLWVCKLPFHQEVCMCVIHPSIKGFVCVSSTLPSWGLCVCHGVMSCVHHGVCLCVSHPSIMGFVCVSATLPSWGLCVCQPPFHRGVCLCVSHPSIMGF